MKHLLERGTLLNNSIHEETRRARISPGLSFGMLVAFRSYGKLPVTDGGFVEKSRSCVMMTISCRRAYSSTSKSFVDFSMTSETRMMFQPSPFQAERRSGVRCSCLQGRIAQAPAAPFIRSVEAAEFAEVSSPGDRVLAGYPRPAKLLPRGWHRCNRGHEIRPSPTPAACVSRPCCVHGPGARTRGHGERASVIQ